MSQSPSTEPLEDEATSLLQPEQLERLTAALARSYAIARPLGKGGMATVFLARDLRHDRDVAIKVLLPELAASLGPERFLREIKIAARLRHPHILPLYDSGDADGFVYYVMPVEGESLRQRLQRDRTVPLEEAQTIALEVLGALEYAHGEGIVHRDIKPENILLSQGHAIIADFGIARAFHAAGGERLTQAGIPIGSPAYMSPEQMYADVELDGRSDVYSLALVLCEMLTGRQVFTGPHMQALLARRLKTPVPDISFPAIVPDHMGAAIRWALSDDCEKRPAGGKAFAKLLTGDVATPTSYPTPAESARAAVATKSIAVLPFANLSKDPENEYFSDGITEEIINALAQLNDLHVAARTSSFAFKDTKQDIGEIATSLKVATVLEGSVRKAGQQLRVTAQLINAADGYHIWSQRFDREMDDVFAIQDEIAAAIVDRLKVTLAGDQDEHLVKQRTKDVVAYQLYLKGRHHWNRRTKEGLKQAVHYFQQSIERDPTYACAYSGMADAYLLQGSYGYIPRSEAHSKAEAAVARAIELDDTLPEAHTSRGQVLRRQRDWKSEEQAYRRAIELNPNYATAHHWYGTQLAALGRFDEAKREIRLAEELDPLSHAISVTVAVVLFVAREYDAALEQLEKTLKLEPNFASTHAWLAIVHAEQGRYDEAVRAVERAVELNPDNPNVLFGLAYAHAKWGEAEKARAVVERARARGGVGWCAMIYGALGDHDAAFECLDEATHGQTGWDSLQFLGVFPWFDPLRSDPRFGEFLRRLNFPE